MKMETFAEMICTEVRRALGGKASVEVREVRKNNGVILHGLMFRKQGCNVSPTVYLDTYLEAYEAGTAQWRFIVNWAVSNSAGLLSLNGVQHDLSRRTEDVVGSSDLLNGYGTGSATG